jgi:hypothetical protein
MVLRKVLFASGLCLLIVGAILIPTSIFASQNKQYIPYNSIQTPGSSGEPYSRSVYFEAGNYLIKIYFTYFQPRDHPQFFKIEDPHGGIVWETGEPASEKEVTITESGNYTISTSGFSGIIDDNDINDIDINVNISEVIVESSTPYSNLLFAGVSLSVIGFAIMLVGLFYKSLPSVTITASPKTKPTSAHD